MYCIPRFFTDKKNGYNLPTQQSSSVLDRIIGSDNSRDSTWMVQKNASFSTADFAARCRRVQVQLRRFRCATQSALDLTHWIRTAAGTNGSCPHSAKQAAFVYGCSDFWLLSSGWPTFRASSFGCWKLSSLRDYVLVLVLSGHLSSERVLSPVSRNCWKTHYLRNATDSMP